ncbi:MAG: hypothetical protein D9V47_14225 [Clostridia bacterium]|nr:MAG: hypothetical protein D9V47_14225 [Clostridia bacterium]
MKANYALKLDVFEGPLDLLLRLIEAQELDIYHVSVAEVTDQYLAFWESLDIKDLDTASEFMVMAATLLLLKARMLLPHPVPASEAETQETDPSRELALMLADYRQIKILAQYLQQLEAGHGRVYHRPAVHERGLAPGDLKDLLAAWTRMVEAAGRAGEQRRALARTVARRRVTVMQRMAEIRRTLRRRSPAVACFTELVAGTTSRADIVVTFLAVLELCRLGYVHLEQEETFGEIKILPGEG